MKPATSASPRAAWCPGLLKVECLTLLCGVLLAASCTGRPSGPTAPGTPPREDREVARIDLGPASAELTYLGATLQLEVHVLDGDGAPIGNVELSWTSSDLSILTVSSRGIVEARAPGTATVRASVGAVTSDPVRVEVRQVVTSVEVVPGTLWMPLLGETAPLAVVARDQGGSSVPNAPLTWASTAPSIATVSTVGVVTAVSNGSTTITASGEGGIGEAQVTVRHSAPVCGSGASLVAIVLEAELMEGIRESLNRFEEDLCREGYTVHERLSGFRDPTQVRAYLSDLYEDSGGELEGTLLIGAIPYAYQFVEGNFTNPNLSPLRETVISYQYYADLNGRFTAPGAARPGTSAEPYTGHSGDLDWEIWVGVLPHYKGSRTATVQALDRYFDKNHSYRTGRGALPRGFLAVNEHHVSRTPEEDAFFLEGMRSGEFAWLPFSAGSGAQLFIDSTNPSVGLARGYEQLTLGVADFTVTDAHGSPVNSGQMDISWVERNPLRTYFFWSNGCAVGNLDFEENFLTAVLYDPMSMVVVAKGTTNDSGGMGTNLEGFFGRNVATALSRGRNLGDSIIEHVNVPLRWPWSMSREFHFATSIVLGDPTLTLRR